MTNGFTIGVSWLWVFVLVAGLAALAWGLVAAASAGGRGGRVDGGAAREILRERFARGEITEQELRERLRVLDEH